METISTIAPGTEDLLHKILEAPGSPNPVRITKASDLSRGLQVDAIAEIYHWPSDDRQYWLGARYVPEHVLRRIRCCSDLPEESFIQVIGVAAGWYNKSSRPMREYKDQMNDYLCRYYHLGRTT